MSKFPLEIQSSIIPIDVLCKGPRDSKIIKMVLDTGASITTIPAEIALAIGCDPSKPKKRIEIITASGIEYVPIIEVPKVELLGYELKNVEVACLSLPPQSAVDGLLGLNVLSKFDVHLNFRSKTLKMIR